MNVAQVKMGKRKCRAEQAWDGSQFLTAGADV